MIKKIVFTSVLIILLSLGLSFGATRFVFEDFEDQDFTDTFVSTAQTYCNVWSTAMCITSNSPFQGQYCLRYQATSGYSDPIENITGYVNSRINIGELTPVSGDCGVYTDFQSHFTDKFAVRFRIRYDSNFDWYGNCKKIVRVKGTKWGANGLMTWTQRESSIHAYMGDEFISKSNPDTMYLPYKPPLGEWITVIVYMNFANDTILFRAIDSSGTHDIYNGTYYSTEGPGYSGGRPTYITLVGAQCGSGTGGNRGLQIDNVEIWDGMPTGINPPKNLRKVPTP